MTTGGRLLSVNVGSPRQIEWLGRVEATSIWKEPIEGRIPVRGVNVAGDDQADREVHGGPDKAVYAYAREDTDWWEKELGRDLEHGVFGENLTTQGVDVCGAVVGEHWEVGSAALEVCQPRIPCWKLGARMGDQNFPVYFAAAGRPGAYLRIMREGEIGAGDEIRVVEQPGHGVTVGEVARIYHQERARARTLLSVPQLAPEWREWAAKRVGGPERESAEV
ncbi:MAG: MOSC domain-containing protein [Gaiellaceae bacterium]